MTRRLTRPLALRLLIVVAATTMAGGACSSGSKSTGSPTTPVPGNTAPAGTSPSQDALSSTTVVSPTAVAGTSITIKGFAFQPGELAAKMGDTITVTNADGTDHTLSAVDGSFDTGRFSSGTKTFVVSKAGRVEFRCQVHSFMPHGFIQVSG